MAVEEVTTLGYGNPTEFEIITCAGFLYFYKMKADFVVVEVGLGGRLDSTNVIDPILSVIGSISYDHMNILGNTLEEIAYEKGGIIKYNTPVVLYPQEDKVTKVIENICKEKNSSLIKVKRENASLVKVGGYKENTVVQYLNIITERDSYNVKLSLLGTYQVQNCNVVINVCETLIDLGVNITKESITNGFIILMV